MEAMTNEEQTQPAQHVAKGFEAALNQHGYSFQARLLREVQELGRLGRLNWLVKVPEFPVEVRGSGTRIDFILKYQHHDLYLLAECKRANPSVANWCFAKSGFIPSIDLARVLFVETVKISSDLIVNDKPHTSVDTRFIGHSDFIYHIALEVKTGEQGNPGGPGRGAIEEAATQVCRGLNGMLSFIQDKPHVLQARGLISFIPVIFTTARLWVSDIDLGTADLQTGNIDLTAANFQERKWLFYHYYQSPGLKHSLPLTNSYSYPALDKILYHEYVRTIAIVNALGSEEFLGLDNIWMC
jgi:hypothetical protein